MWMAHDGPTWWWMFGGIGMLLFWGALIWLGAMLVRSTGSRPRVISSADPMEAEHILARRFASGEISEEEYRRSLSVLRRGG